MSDKNAPFFDIDEFNEPLFSVYFKKMTLNKSATKIYGHLKEYFESSVDKIIENNGAEITVLKNGINEKYIFNKIGYFGNTHIYKIKVKEFEDDFDINYESLVSDYLNFSHDNILVWDFLDPLDLSVNLEEKISKTVKSVVLKQIIKSSSGFLVDIDHSEIIGKNVTDLFNINSDTLLDAVKDFYQNDLFIKDKIIRLGSPLDSKKITYQLNMKGYEVNGFLKTILVTSQNISEQIENEEQLKLTKKMLNDAEIIGKQAAFVFWPDKDIAWWSENNYPLYGLDSKDDGAYDKIRNLECVLPEYHKPIRELISNATKGVENKLHFKVKMPDDSIRDFEIICTKNEDDDAQEYRVNGLIRDISNELAMSHEIREKSVAWEKYEETTPGAFFAYAISAEGVPYVSYYSKKLLELADLPLDTSPENVLQSYIDNIHKEDLDKYYESISNSVTNEEKWKNKHRLKQIDGSYKWIRGISSPKKDENGDLVFYGILIDITEEENRAHQLNLANHKYALATQTARMGIWEFDLHTNRVEVDHQLKHIYNLSDSDSNSIHFEKWLNYVDSNFMNEVRQSIINAVNGGKDIDLTYKVNIDKKEYYHNTLGLVLSDNFGNAYKILGVTRDVTETVSYQSQLEEVNSIYELATQSAQMGLWDWDLSTNELSWNDMHFEIFNMQKVSNIIKYETFQSLIHQDDLSAVETVLQEALSTGKAQVPIFRVYKENIGWGYFQAAGTVVYDDAGKATKMLGIVWEVTDTVKYQEQLKEASIKYQLATKTAKMGIWDLTLPSMQLSWDDELHQIFETDKNRPITYSDWLKLVHNEDKDRLERHLGLALKGEREFSEVFRHQLSDHTWAYNKTRAVVLRNEKNEAVRVLGVSWDVSDMIQYQKNLENLNLKYRLATKSIRIGLWDYNPKTDSVIWDPALAEMYGIPNSFEESFPIEQILQVIDEKDRDRFHQSIKDSIKHKWVEFNESYTVNNPITGKVKHIEIVCAPQFDDDGNIERMLGLSFDNTEAVDRELELVKVLETREKLFNVIAHDLKGPISNLIGVSEFLTHDYDDLADKEIKEFLLMIRKSSLTASNLMNNLITWTRNISNRIPFKPEFESIDRFFNTVISFYEETMKLKGINILIDEQSYLDKVFVDINMIDTIMRNLVGNAVKFSKKGDTVTLSAYKAEREINIIVSDTGIGMTEEQIQMILKQDGKFQKAGTAKERGTGLGLIIVQDFIKKHKGQLTISSSESSGSVFRITIPQP
jgi:signal transduction histidine kinase